MKFYQKFFKENSRKLSQDNLSSQVSQIYGQAGDFYKIEREKLHYAADHWVPYYGAYRCWKDKRAGKPTVFTRKKGETKQHHNLRKAKYIGFHTAWYASDVLKYGAILAAIIVTKSTS
ncbi:MAG: hypothetical protein ISS95_00275 [Candidatus Aenigmarchaeota archaeon]|nr:hypothetical protein [Candidatus Aenigmarchaeota archaeon]